MLHLKSAESTNWAIEPFKVKDVYEIYVHINFFVSVYLP